MTGVRINDLFSTSLLSFFFFSCLQRQHFVHLCLCVPEKIMPLSLQLVTVKECLFSLQGAYLFQLHFLLFLPKVIESLLINTLLLRFTRSNCNCRCFKLMSFIIMSQKINELKNYSFCRYSALVSHHVPAVCGVFF